MGIGSHGPQDLKVRIHSLLNGLWGDVQMGQGVQFEATRLDDGDHAAGRGEPVDREHSQRGRAVEEHDRIVRQDRLCQTGSEKELPPRFAEQFSLGPAKLDSAGCYTSNHMFGHSKDQLDCPSQIKRLEFFIAQNSLELRIQLTTKSGNSSFADIDGRVARNGKLPTYQSDHLITFRVQPKVVSGIVKVVEIADGYVLSRQGRSELLGHRFDHGNAVDHYGRNKGITADGIQ